MQLLDSLDIERSGEKRTIELWHGDLTDMPVGQAVDVLIVSAFPNSYYPLKGTLIGALQEKGVSVKTLAQDKQEDLRAACHCWLSKEVTAAASGIQFKHILCFEPPFLGKPADVVGDIFRSLVPFVIGGPQYTQVAMPLVSTGSVGAPLAEMVDALFTAAVNWMESGLPLQRLKIVELDPVKAAEIKGAFGILKRRFHQEAERKKRQIKYDVFISYSHANTDCAQYIIQQLRAADPNLRIFYDRIELVPGVAWQEKLYRSLDQARKVVTLFSPEYVRSKMCQEEFNFSSLLHARTGEKTLFPILLFDTDLLPQMSKWQYTDCKIADQHKINEACEKLLADLAQQSS